MKMNKKLLVFLLACVMLIGAFAVWALAGEETATATVVYPDGSQTSVAVGEKIPGVDGTLCYAPGNTLYKNCTITGATDGTVPEGAAGQTITITGTKVYFAVSVIGGETTYYTDGSTAGTDLYNYMYSEKDAADVEIKLYANITARLTHFRGPTNSVYYFDLNGHELTNTVILTVFGGKFSLYSSQPGGVVHAEEGTALYSTSDDWNNKGTGCSGSFYIGEKYGKTESDPSYGANLTVYCKRINWGLDASAGTTTISGGTFIQTVDSDAAQFLLMSTHEAAYGKYTDKVQNVSNATFILSNPNTVPINVNMSKKRSFTSCTFISPNKAGVALWYGDDFNSWGLRGSAFVNCNFINVVPVYFDWVRIEINDCSFGTTEDAVFPTNNRNITGTGILAHGTSKKIITVLDKTYVLDGTVVSSTSNALLINFEGIGAEYWMKDTMPTKDAGGQVIIDIQNQKYFSGACYDLTGASQIVGGKVVSAGSISAPITNEREDALAFTYLDTATQKLYGVGYNYDCGATPEGLFDKFYDLFSNPSAAYIITMYSDLTVTRAIPFGPMTAGYSGDGYNRDYYNSMVKGSIVWDLNGHTVTVAENSTYVNLNAADYAVSTPNVPLGSNYAIFGLEGANTNSLTVRSSKAGGRFINHSSAALFGVGEGAKSSCFIQGENLTVETVGAIFFGYSSHNGIQHLEINGGTYFYQGEKQPISLSGGAEVIKNATIVCTQAVEKLFGFDLYRQTVVTIENCTLATPSNAPLFGGGGAEGDDFSGSGATVKDCALLGVQPMLTMHQSKESAVTYSGANAFSTEEALAAVYAEAPADSAKYAFAVGVPNAQGGFDLKDAVGYAKAGDVYAVTYSGANTEKHYLVGKYYVPIAMDAAYYTITVDVAKGTANIPVAWAGGIAANSIISESGAVTLTPKENNVAVAFALYDTVEADVVGYGVSGSDSIGAALAAALAGQTNAGKLYVFEDITAGALTVARELEILLSAKTLTLGASLAVNAALTVEGGAILSAAETPFVLEADVILNKTSVYLSNAAVVFGGNAGKATLKEVSLFNLASAAMVENGVTAVYQSGKVMGVALGTGVTVSGTVLGTEGTFAAGCAYGSGVIGGIAVNNRYDTVTVLGTAYTVEYAEAATEDAALAINVTYVYGGVARAEQIYYYGSIPSMYREFAEGYYFIYEGETSLTEDVTLECRFVADENKLKAQIVLGDALSGIFYLKVEEEGIFTNLKLNGVDLDFASLQIQNIDGTDFYVIPVVFASFADTINDYVLSVDLNSSIDTMAITASISLDDYIAEVLAEGTEAEAKKAYAVAEYVSTLITYFDYSFSYKDARAKNLGKLNNLLADYAQHKTEAPLPGANGLLSSAYVQSVSLVAKEKITFAFRIADGFAGTLEVNGVEQAVSPPFAGYERDYVLASVALEDIDESITITVKAVGGETLEVFTYSLADYVGGITEQNEGAVGAYAKALWNLAAAFG